MDFGRPKKLVPKKFHKKRQKRITTNLVLPVSFHQSLSLIINSNKVMMHNPPNFHMLSETIINSHYKIIAAKRIPFQGDSCE